MFERYTERARRTIFFARYEASQFGSAYIETEHLLLGILREDKALANHVLGSYEKLEAIRASIGRRGTKGPKIAISVDLPLSNESKRVLGYAAEESERLNHMEIGTPHLLVGLLHEETSFAAELLREQGLTLDLVRERVQRSDVSLEGGSVSMAGLGRWIAEREEEGSPWTLKQKRLKNGTTHFAICAGGAPVLCIEVIRDDLFSQVRKRCDSYLTEGVAEVWLLEPGLKRAYTVTQAEGLREFKGEILRIADPPLEMDLRTIFD